MAEIALTLIQHKELSGRNIKVNAVIILLVYMHLQKLELLLCDGWNFFECWSLMYLYVVWPHLRYTRDFPLLFGPSFLAQINIHYVYWLVERKNNIGRTKRIFRSYNIFYILFYSYPPLWGNIKCLHKMSHTLGNVAWNVWRKII